MKIKKKTRNILLILLLILFILYWTICYFAVSMALIPSFMEKTDAFSEVTEVSMEALVQTNDIQNNHAAAIKTTNEWLQTANAQKLSLTTEDGYRLIGVAFSPETESHKWALLLHGYTGWKEELYPVAYQYVQRGYHVLVPDLRCSGESEGDFIGMGWTDRMDNLLWLNKITEADPAAKIVIHGQSMGGAGALMLSGEKLPPQVSAIISDCAYTDAYRMFGKQMKDWFHLPSFPLLDSMNLMLQLRGGYDLKAASALEAVKHTKLPVLIIHGDQDELVPVDMAYELYEAAGGEKELLIISGAGHAQSADKDPRLYYDTIFRFLQAH